MTKLKAARRRAAMNAAISGACLAANAWAADGHYDQHRLWGIAILGAAFVASLTAQAVATVLIEAGETK